MYWKQGGIRRGGGGVTATSSPPPPPSSPPPTPPSPPTTAATTTPSPFISPARFCNNGNGGEPFFPGAHPTTNQQQHCATTHTAAAATFLKDKNPRLFRVCVCVLCAMGPARSLEQLRFFPYLVRRQSGHGRRARDVRRRRRRRQQQQQQHHHDGPKTFFPRRSSSCWLLLWNNRQQCCCLPSFVGSLVRPPRSGRAETERTTTTKRPQRSRSPSARTCLPPIGILHSTQREMGVREL